MKTSRKLRVYFPVLLVLFGSTTAHAALISGSGLVLDTDTNLLWCADLTDFADMTYQQQQAIVTGLNSSRFGGMTDWHLASQSEVNDLLSSKTTARLQSLGNAFTPTTYYETPLGNWSANWIGRTGTPYLFFQDKHVSMGISKGLSSPWGYGFGSYSDNYADPTIGAWVVASQAAGASPDDPLPPPDPDPGPGWRFDFPVRHSQVVYVDPVVAMGYDFHVSVG
jgi:hypothetical protein